jgi:hypothetical protein
MALETTQSVTEMSTKNLPGGYVRSARKGDNPTPSVGGLSRERGSVDILQPYWPPRTVQAWITFTFTREITR